MTGDRFQVTGDTGHVTYDMIYFKDSFLLHIFEFFGIGFTVSTHRDIQCLPYVSCLPVHLPWYNQNKMSCVICKKIVQTCQQNWVLSFTIWPEVSSPSNSNCQRRGKTPNRYCNFWTPVLKCASTPCRFPLWNLWSYPLQKNAKNSVL